ncbi:LytR/AlgR family response regulator transcription factor [Tepidibacter thalassicus]|uniref:Stage 0 sporulation protein A homolog n=1 Tax=Tepidibacter thalassicus DSM 15285 TaxID=1123350 RepID=A0A1M5R452_9FIRM|nr:LytTR family DNA-binding domain-containing protein [Tepidibacter thalassicus]SHH20543.1 two component transcriptional regulator, LytTR family [Tepidibacter thalassicus DSM 15285]
MINFVICEDDRVISSEVVNIVEGFMAKQEYSFSIGLVKDSTKGVVDYVKQNLDKKNIYILDIELKDNKNGIQLAREIRKYDNNGEIIFLTNHPTMVMYVFKYRLKALDFIDKQDDIKRRLIENFEIILSKYLKTENKFITIKCGNRTYLLNLDEIISIKTTNINGKLRVSTIDGQIEFYGRLKNIEKELDERFYKSHKACIVNKNYIKLINKKRNDMYILMSNGELCFLSKKYIKGLVKGME